MTSYTKSTNFATKDTLTSGDPLKIVKGTEINTEFDNIATAVNSKSDTASPTFTGTVTIPTLSVSGVISAASPNITTSITTPSTSFDLLNTTATTLNLAGAATAVNVGAATGTMTVANTTLAAKAITASTTLGVTGTTTLTGVATLTANPVLSAGTANGVAYLNGSKSLTSGSAITFDGTNFFTTGTASATKLIPTGTSVTGNGLYLPAANSLGLSTNGTNAVYIDSSQNVGIGVTPSTWSTGKAIQVGTLQAAIWGAGDQIDISGNAYFNSGWKAAATKAGASLYEQALGVHTWSSSGSVTADAAITFTQVLGVKKDFSLALQGATSASGIGIAFPATQSASSDANTLDDYEESTWTPTLAFGGASVGITYTASYNTASVTKIGSRVFVSGITSLTSKGSSTGNASLTSLPFPADGIKAFSAVACSLTGVTFTGQYAMELDANADVVYFYQVSALGVQSALTNTNFANTSSFVFNFSYFTAS